MHSPLAFRSAFWAGVRPGRNLEEFVPELGCSRGEGMTRVVPRSMGVVEEEVKAAL
jgi:hypothetical protein